MRNRLVRCVHNFIQRLRADGCTGLAGMLAYNFFLALPALLIFMITVLAFLPVEDVVSQTTGQLSEVLPADALSLLTRVLETTLQRGRGSLTVLFLSLLGTMYVLNNGYAGLIGSMNRIYNFDETRPWLRVRLRALVMSVIASGLLVATFGMLLVAPLIVHALSADQGFDLTVGFWLERMRWPAILFLAVLGIESTYRYAPNGRLRFRLISPGTFFATGFWLLATLAFGFYVDHFNSYQSVYGGLGAVIVILTWLWISAMIFLTGAEINVVWHEWRESRIRHPARTTSPAPDV